MATSSGSALLRRLVSSQSAAFFVIRYTGQTVNLSSMVKIKSKEWNVISLNDKQPFLKRESLFIVFRLYYIPKTIKYFF